jgi:putative ABC transport system permease protein
MFSNSSNTIITSSNAVLAMNTSDSNLKVNINPTFVLKDEASIKKFTKEVKSKGLDSHYTVTTNLDSIDESLTSISNLQTFANTFLIITFILGAVVLFVINHINLRERKYEIGVLRTIGMKKSKVCMQFMAELFIVAFVSLILGTGIGTAISSPVSNTLLKNEISSSQQSANTVRQNFGQGTNQGGPDSFDKSISSTKKVESLKTTVSPKVLAELFAIGIALTLISSASAIIAINRFSPLTILKERS